MASKIIPRFAPLLRLETAFQSTSNFPNRDISAYKCFSTSSPISNSGDASSLNYSPPATPLQTKDGRWLSTMKTRIGKCVFHGLKNEETSQTSMILADLAENWREYVAGSQGFLTGRHRRGLFRHSVVWGDMVGSFFA